LPSAVKLRRADTANSKTAARFQKKRAAVFLPLSAGSAHITAEKNYRADIVSTTVTALACCTKKVFESLAMQIMGRAIFLILFIMLSPAALG
jgi:hypothetical protein